jgi:predicted transposase YbfD/YdcC
MMDNSLIACMERIPDPRKGNAKVYNLADVLVIAVLATLCGMNTFVEMELFARERRDWLCKFLKLENGTPSHDTFGKICATVDPKAFTAAFGDWVQSIRTKFNKEVVAIDGKTVRASRDIANKKKPLHMVSAWAAENHLILGEIATREKSNEITAIPELLDILDVSGCIVTIDAVGTQTKIAEEIIEKKADYLLSVKENQPNLHADIRTFFESSESEHCACFSTEEKGHGRIEKRFCRIEKNVEWLDPEKRWKNLSGIAQILSISTNLSTDETSKALHYFIFSNADMTAKEVLETKRAHWGIESMHWILDVAYREDQCRARKNNAAAVLNILRHFTMNLLKQETTSKGGIAVRRSRCCLSPAYAEKVLGIS